MHLSQQRGVLVSCRSKWGDVGCGEMGSKNLEGSYRLHHKPFDAPDDATLGDRVL